MTGDDAPRDDATGDDVSRKREMAFALGLLALGALVTFVAAGQPRVSPGLGGEQISGARTPAGTALALVALAGAGAVILTRSWLRLAIGVLLLAGAVGVVVAFLSRDIGSIGVGASAPLAAVIHARRSLWAWLGVGGGVLIGLGAIAVILRGRRWPAPRRRFDAPTRDSHRSQDPWTALDDGVDPTV